MQIYIYVYIDIYVWSYTNNRSVVHLDSDCTQQFPEGLAAVPSGHQSSWANWAFFALRDQEQHQCNHTWNHTALGTSWEEQGHHSGWLHTVHRALVYHPPEEHVIERHGCVCTAVVFPATKPPPLPRAPCNASQGRATAQPCRQPAAARSPRRCQLLVPLHPNILVPSVKMLVFRAGWAFVFNL